MRKLLLATINCFLMIFLTQCAFNNQNISGEQYSVQKQLIRSYYDTFLKYSDEYYSYEYREMHSDPSNPFPSPSLLTESQKEVFDSIFADEETYREIIGNLKPWFSQQRDEFLFSIDHAKILNIEKFKNDTHWKVTLNTAHILYNKYKDVSKAISVSFPGYSVVNISKKDYKKALEKWEETPKTFFKGTVLVFSTVEDHYFRLEKINNSYKIKSIKKEVISYKYNAG